jgi:hypothetical protein
VVGGEHHDGNKEKALTSPHDVVSLKPRSASQGMPSVPYRLGHKAEINPQISATRRQTVRMQSEI